MFLAFGFAVTSTVPGEGGSPGSVVLGTRGARTLRGEAVSRGVVVASLSLFGAGTRAGMGRVRLQVLMGTRMAGTGCGLSVRGLVCVAFAVTTLVTVRRSPLSMG